MPAGSGHVGGQEAQVVGVGGGHAPVRLARPHWPLLVYQLLQHLLHSYPLTICSQSSTHPFCSCIASVYPVPHGLQSPLMIHDDSSSEGQATGWMQAKQIALFQDGLLFAAEQIMPVTGEVFEPDGPHHLLVSSHAQCHCKCCRHQSRHDGVAMICALHMCPVPLVQAPLMWHPHLRGTFDSIDNNPLPCAYAC